MSNNVKNSKKDIKYYENLKKENATLAEKNLKNEQLDDENQKLKDELNKHLRNNID